MSHFQKKGFSASEIKKIQHWLEDDNNHSLVCFDDELYPPLLREISSPPRVLFVNGDSQKLLQPCFAIVGSRSSTPVGIKNAAEFAKELASRGFNIVSGMAFGIDSAAHNGALQTGMTTAVFGTGIDRVYPPANHQLAKSIAQQGCLLSEFMLGAPPKRYHFPKRNRIITGMSLGLLVVEATFKSGSLVSARLSMEQNREVFALPGSINNPNAAGCNKLIRDGAQLVTSVDDIVDTLRPMLAAHKMKLEKLDVSKPKEEQPISHPLLAHINFEPTSFDIIAANSGMDASQLNSELIELELAGKICCINGGFQRL